ncbi:MAG: YdcF family protein [Selenomonadaceae bacterium]|nr:YdcF family protein [Selenomonadaceae bacterium]
MVYLLKFGAGWLLPPGTFILLLLFLVWRLWKKNERRIAAALAGVTFVLYLFCTSLLAEALMSRLENAYPVPDNPQGDVIIMLGGGALPDTHDVDGAGTLCASPANRLLTAARLQRKLNIPVLLSGGKVYDDSGEEAKIAARVLEGLGVPPEMILVETRSINTNQNARFSAEILSEQGLTRPILVTSAFHMKRSVLNFTEYGVKVLPYPADYLTNPEHTFHYNKLKPSADALRDNVTVLQEALRTVVTQISGL